MPRILVFDVNETLLDLRVLEPHFERVFGDKAMLREWFNQVIQFAEALTLAGDYRSFGDQGRMTRCSHLKITSLRKPSRPMVTSPTKMRSVRNPRCDSKIIIPKPRSAATSSATTM